jgi:hypothetical protein
MLAEKTIGTVVSMIAPCTRRYDGFAANFTDEGFIAWVCFIVILLE